MSIFGAIKDAIFGKAEAATPDAAPAPVVIAPTPPPPAPVRATPEEIDARLASIAADKGQPSNYKTSIVDLMKLLSLDSSLDNRITLAKELGYTGDTNDSATMNIWLHKQVMESLANKGG
jgi:hypothetical protein